MPDNPTALRAAMQGKKVSDRQTKSALSAAVTKIAGLTRRAQRSKEAMAETGSAVIHTAEANGSLFLASLAEGYFGADKLKLGSVDLRAPAGIAAVGFGLYETMSGKSTGGHALAIGNGVLGSWLASVATQAGRTLAEKRAAPTQPEAPPAFHLMPAIQGPALPEPELEGPLREVLLTPEAESLEGPDWLPRRRRRRRGRPLPRRSLRRRRQSEDFDDFDQPDPDTEEV
ncbi:MAG: hypothetical protein R3F61_30675 [Myxococcota bacterium]